MAILTCKVSSSLSGVSAPGAGAPEVPGVEEELPPGQGGLGGLQVTRAQLFSFLDSKASMDLHLVLAREILGICVAPGIESASDAWALGFYGLHAGMIKKCLDWKDPDPAPKSRWKMKKSSIG